MKFNSKSLAMRDPSMAALVGAIGGSDFGADSQFAGEFAGDFGVEGFFGGEGFFGADAPAAANPTPQEMIQLWKNHSQAVQTTARRTSMLNPNERSMKKIERYSLTLGDTVVVGTATPINITKSPDTELRGQRISTNVPSPGFIYLSEVKVANVSVTQGDALDAWQLNANGWGMQYDLPTLSPANRVTVLGDSTTAVPTGFNDEDSFRFSLTIVGPASMAG